MIPTNGNGSHTPQTSSVATGHSCSQILECGWGEATAGEHMRCWWLIWDNIKGFSRDYQNHNPFWQWRVKQVVWLDGVCCIIAHASHSRSNHWSIRVLLWLSFIHNNVSSEPINPTWLWAEPTSRAMGALECWLIIVVDFGCLLEGITARLVAIEGHE